MKRRLKIMWYEFLWLLLGDQWRLKRWIKAKWEK